MSTPYLCDRIVNSTDPGYMSDFKLSLLIATVKTAWIRGKHRVILRLIQIQAGLKLNINISSQTVVNLLNLTMKQTRVRACASICTCSRQG